MKKIKILLISLISIFAFNVNVHAATASLSLSSESVYVGDSFTVTVGVNSSAAWNIHVSASGPVSGCVINQADATADAMDTNKSFSTTCTATGEGTITINLSGDVTSATDGNAVNISGSRGVTVSKRPAPSNNNSNNSNNKANTNNNSSNTNSNKSNTNNNQQNNNNKTDNKSKNNNIKELSIDGYKLEKVDANNYTLSVPNDVEKINIKAIAEDSKSKVTGAGNHDIKVGENNIEVIVTAENGSQNKINIKVTRKDEYYIEDLDSVLKNNKIDNINITIKSDTIISSEDLEKIKNSKKTIKFNYYNDNKLLMYSWIVDGSQLDDISELITIISNDSDNKKDILRLSNYADGLFVGLKQINKLPVGIKIKLYVGDKYTDNDLPNVYAYQKNGDELKLVEKNIKLKNGYIEFNLTNSSDYFITMSLISKVDEEIISNNTQENSSTIILIFISIILIFIIFGIFVLVRKNKKSNYKINTYKNGDDYTYNKPKDDVTPSSNNIERNISMQGINNSTIKNNYSVNGIDEKYINQNNSIINNSQIIGNENNYTDNEMPFKKEDNHNYDSQTVTLSSLYFNSLNEDDKDKN